MPLQVASWTVDSPAYTNGIHASSPDLDNSSQVFNPSLVRRQVATLLLHPSARYMARMAAAMVLVDPVLRVRGVTVGQQVVRHQSCRFVYGAVK